MRALGTTRPDERELDEELRGHLALSVKERIDRGEDPETARLAALRELGYVPAIRDSMRRVWYGRGFDAAAALGREMRIAVRSLLRTKALGATVVVTLALGIGANAAIFSVVRGVLLRPLVNRGEDRLVYIRQSAPGVGLDNMTFSVPEIADFKARSTTIAAFGDFSTIEFTMLGFGEPRLVRAGVVNGSFFEVMGLRPVLGRLLNPTDDGPGAAPAAVLTHRFWTGPLHSDPKVIGKPIGLGPVTATIVGVLEPSVPYPADTEIIANVVTSPHHLGATMTTDREHRMTELFGRLAPGATFEGARADLIAAHDAMRREHPEAYSQNTGLQLSVTRLRDQITAPARTILLVLLAAAAVVFVIACSNVANLILARTVRREGELAVRAALGASRSALRRTLLAESLVLCGAGALLGLALARPLVSIVARYAARFSVRALEVAVDGTLLWVGAGLALAAAVLLAYVPRLPTDTPARLGLASGGIRITPGNQRRLRLFATAQIAFSFVLLVGAGMLVAALLALQAKNSGYADTRRLLALDVPPLAVGEEGAKQFAFFREADRRIGELPGVLGVTQGNVVPWRDAGAWPRLPFAVEGYRPEEGEESLFARPRFVGPGFFGVLGIPMIAGRDFTADDRPDGEPVAIVSQSLARRLFRNGAALNRKLWWTFRTERPCRIVGIVPDVDDESLAGSPSPAIYQPYSQMGVASRLFVRASGDPRALVPAVTRILRRISADQAVERAATLDEIRSEVLSPERMNASIVSGFAGIALLIAVVGVSGVLAFSVSARTREFGVRLAVGSAPRQILARVLKEGAAIAAIGIAAGALGGYALAFLAASHWKSVSPPGPWPMLAAAAVLAIAAVVASLMPAARAARVDVLSALRSE